METELVLWNCRNRPPMEEAQVRKVARSIAGREASKGKPEEEPAPSFAIPLSAIMALKDAPVDYLATGLLEQGTIGFVGGEPKLGKSWLTLHIALTVATGTPVLGTFPVPRKAKVLYVQEEDGAGLLAKRIRLLCAGHGMQNPGDEDFRAAVRTGFKIDDPRWFQALHRELEAFHPSLVVVDVLNKVHMADENEQTEMTRIMGLFESLRREFGCGFLIVHHFRKQGGDGSSRGNQRLRGSSVLGGWSECSLYLSGMANKGLRVEHESKNPTLEPFAFRLEDQKDEAGNLTGVRLTYQGVAAVLQQSEKLNEMLEVVQEAFAKGGPEACTAKSLAERAKVSENTARAQLKLLEDAGEVQQVKVRPGGQGREIAAFQPSHEAPGDSSAAQPPRGIELMSQPGGPPEQDGSDQMVAVELSYPVREGVARG